MQNSTKSQEKPRVCISTHYLFQGGVLSVTRFLYSYLTKREYMPSLFYPLDQIGFRNFWRIVKPRLWERPELGMVGYGAESMFQIDALKYAIPARALGNSASGFEIYHAVGGSALSGLPFAISNRPYFCWVSTTLRDERGAQPGEGSPAHADVKTKALTMLNRVLYPVLLREEELTFRKAAMIQAHSSHTAQRIVAEYNVDRSKVSVIPFPVNTARFSPGGSTSGFAGGLPYILTVGRIADPRKNIQLLLKAFARLRRSFPAVGLVIVGNAGPMKQQIMKLCQKLNIEDKVHITGVVAEKRLVSLYQNAELFALSSRQEGFGIVLVEAMACGIPVISTRCGGPEEIILDGETGYLVTNEDEEELAAAMGKLLGDRLLNRKMGHAARRRVQAHYSEDVIGAKLIESYRSVYPHLY